MKGRSQSVYLTSFFLFAAKSTGLVVRCFMLARHFYCLVRKDAGGVMLTLFDESITSAK
jgi:hypothetical protein